MNDDDTGLDIDEEFADLLDGEFDVDEEAEAAVEAEDDAAIMSRWGLGAFDLDTFLEEIREEPGVSVNSQCLEVPVRYFVQAQQAGLLAGLEVDEDELGRPFLLAIVPTCDDGLVLVSRSLEEVDPEPEE